MATKKKRSRKKHGHYHTGVYESKKGGSVRYRSSWELCYVQHLDVDETVESFIYEGIKIPYLSNVRTGKIRNYMPDLLVTYVDGRRQLVEIKPLKRTEQVANVKKFEAARAWCAESGVEFVVVTEDDLKAMSLL